jgi:hypothetical protein
MAGIAVGTRYIGENTVQIEGTVDQAQFEKVLASRALADVGVKVMPGEQLAAASPDGKADDEKAAVAALPPVDIVAVVRGREPYVVDANGEQYPDGTVIPGHGKLIGIGSKIYVEGPGGEIKQIRPITAAELAARAAASDFSNVVGSPDATSNMNTDAPQQAVNRSQEKIPAPVSSKQ